MDIDQQLGVGDIIEKKLSIADKSAFLKLSANYRYRKKNIWESSISKNENPISFDKLNRKHSSKNKKETTEINRRDKKETHYLYQET